AQGTVGLEGRGQRRLVGVPAEAADEQARGDGRRFARRTGALLDGAHGLLDAGQVPRGLLGADHLEAAAAALLALLTTSELRFLLAGLVSLALPLSAGVGRSRHA